MDISKLNFVPQFIICYLAFTFCMYFPSSSAYGEISIDPCLKPYARVEKIDGKITSRGSDTIRRLMVMWSQQFSGYYPNIRFDIEAKGSSTAPPALLSGKSQLGPMSRKMKKKEYRLFIEKYNMRPIAIGVALDPLAVFVNIKNPISRLSLPELDAIFSRTRKGGYHSDIKNWGHFNQGTQWKNLEISLFTRNNLSGTYAYFRKKALFKGEYKDSIIIQEDSAAIIQRISDHIGGIGYSGIGYKSPGVKYLKLSKHINDPAYTPSYKNILANRYPISRPLYVYVVHQTQKAIPYRVKEFIKFILSKEGQKITLKNGYMPLSSQTANRQLNLIK